MTPNGLHVMDQLGILARIKDRCYMATHRVFKNDKDETIRKTLISHEDMYGYRNHRIWRRVLLDEMRLMLSGRGVKIQYGSKFNGIVEDRSDGITFLIGDARHQATMLIGSDGIYSSVRKYIAPDIHPEYTGTIGILAHIKRSSVAWPYEDYERNATIQGKPGAIFFIPEDPEAIEIMTGKQVQYPEQSRDDLEKLQADKDKLVAFYQDRYDEWGPTVRRIIDQVAASKETCYIWPYLKMPKLQHWYSSSGRVILIGDGAHAVPPSSGQGVNQVLEDVYSLTLLLTSMKQSAETNGTAGTITPTRLVNGLASWQQMRQRRIDAIFDWATGSTNIERMSEEERQKLIAEGKLKDGRASYGDDMSWLYGPNREEQFDAWVGCEKSRLR